MNHTNSDPFTIAPEHRRLIDLELRKGEQLLWASEGRDANPASGAEWFLIISFLSITAIAAAFQGLERLTSASWWFGTGGFAVTAWGTYGVFHLASLIREQRVYEKTAVKIYAVTDQRVLRISAAEQAVEYALISRVRRVRASGEADDGRLDVEDDADHPLEMVGIRNGAEAARLIAGLQPKRGPRTRRRPSIEHRATACKPDTDHDRPHNTLYSDAPSASATSVTSTR